MEKLLKLYDDADEWLSMAWLASGSRLWFLIVIFLSVALVACFLSNLGSAFLAGALIIIIIGAVPALNYRLFR